MKLTLAGGNIGENVGGALVTTVGGVAMRTAASGIQHSSKLAKVNVGGMASLKAGTSVDLSATSITLEALAGLTLSGAGASIALTPGSVKITGDLKIVAGGQVTFTGSQDELTKG